MKLIEILIILRSYGLNDKYPVCAIDHDILGFNLTKEFEDIQFLDEDLMQLEKLGVFYSEEYNSLIMFT